MANTKEKLIVVTQKNMIKKSRHNDIIIHQIIKEHNRNRKNKGFIKQKTMNKMKTVSPYLSIITLNVNSLNYLTKSHGMA